MGSRQCLGMGRGGGWRGWLPPAMSASVLCPFQLYPLLSQSSAPSWQLPVLPRLGAAPGTGNGEICGEHPFPLPPPASPCSPQAGGC